MISSTYILAPLVGGVIGYITNDIAIRMLFRPHKAKYLFGIRIPFTLGIIPKEKGRIAETVGNSISENLMNKEVLERNLLSEDMLTKMEESYDAFIARQRVNAETVRSFLSQHISCVDLSKIQFDAGTELAAQIHSRLADSNLGNMLAHVAVEHAICKMEHSFLGVAFNAEQFLVLLQEPAERLLSKHINQIIKNNSEEIISSLIGQESDKFLDTPVCELLRDRDEQLARLKQVLFDGYTNIITIHLPRILSTIDISRIIRDRINEMDLEEGERIIMEVMRKELRAIVWFGALLGCLIGMVNGLL